MLKLKNDSRVVKIYQRNAEGHEEYSVSFKFPIDEERDYAKIREELGVPPDMRIWNEADEKKFNESGFVDPHAFKINPATSQRITYKTIRESIVDCTGICKSDGIPVNLMSERPYADRYEELQQLIFETIVDIEDFFSLVLIAYAGEDSKNSDSGATESLSGDGTQPSA